MAAFNILPIVGMIVAFTIYQVMGSETTDVEPTCYSKFDYDYKLMQKVSELENEQKVLSEQLFQQSKIIDDLKKERQESVQTLWGEWAAWSMCKFSCSGQEGGRLQTRDRTRSLVPGGTQSESESRPCNAVQFAGCVKQHGPDDNFAIAYDYTDQVAVSTCTALMEAGGHVYAIRRQCSNLTVSCDEICKTNELKCFNSLHIYRPTALGRNDVGKKGVFTYRYNGCTGNFCGPNFCCCKK